MIFLTYIWRISICRFIYYYDIDHYSYRIFLFDEHPYRIYLFKFDQISREILLFIGIHKNNLLLGVFEDIRDVLNLDLGIF